jgi:TetR/AcrR family transcriptional regulator, regulator of autoinduction and epiphytic fitness
MMSDAPAPPVKVDGRVARAERTRAAIIEALVDVLAEGDLQPTAERIAERAGVSLRTIYQHFPDRQALHKAVAERQWREVGKVIEVIPSDLPLEERIDRLVAQRARIWGIVTPVRRVALLNAPFQPEIAQEMARARAVTREGVARLFARELDALPPTERAEVLEGMNVAAEWPTWETLRAHQGLDVEQAQAVVRRMLRALLT